MKTPSAGPLGEISQRSPTDYFTAEVWESLGGSPKLFEGRWRGKVAYYSMRRTSASISPLFSKMPWSHKNTGSVADGYSAKAT